MFGCKEYNQSDFGVDHLVISMGSLLLCCWKRVFAMTSAFSWQNSISLCPAAAAKSLQSYPTLCDPTDGSPPGSPVPGILQARTLEWAAISFSNVWKWKVKVRSLSRVRPSATPWTAAFQAPPSRGFSRQEYWSGVPLPLPYFILYSKAKFACYSGCFLTSYFCILVPYNEKDIFFGC